MQRFVIDPRQHQGGQNRQRQGRADNQRSAPAHHEEQHHKHDQRRQGEIAGQTVQAFIHIIRLTENRLHPHPGHRGGKIGNDGVCRLRPVVDPQFRLQIGRDQDAAASVMQGQRRGRCANALLHIGDIAQPDQLAIGPFGDGDRADAVQTVKLPRHFQRQVNLARAQLPGRRLGISACGQPRQVDHGQPQRGQRGRIGQHADFFLGLAEDLGQLGAGQIAQARFQILAEAGEDRHVLIPAAIPAQGHDHRGRADILPVDIGCQRSGRQLRPGPFHLFPDQRPGLVHLDRGQIFANLQRDDGNARARVRTGQLDLGQLMDGVFQRLGDQGFHPFCRGPRKHRDDGAETLRQRRVFLPPQRHQRAQAGGNQQDDGQGRQPRIAEKQRAHRPRASMCEGTTLWPGVMRLTPEARISSPGSTAPRTKARSASTRTVSTGRASSVWAPAVSGTST